MLASLMHERVCNRYLSGADVQDECRQFMRICEPYNGEDLQWHPVTTAMSKASFQGPECCKPLKRKSITTFFQPKAAPGALLSLKYSSAISA